jgi:hypothetical protein
VDSHPFAVASPCVFDDRRLRDVLGVGEPDPRAALDDLVRWLAESLPLRDLEEVD